MDLPIFAINLDSEVDRWEELAGNAGAAGLSLRRVSAINGRALSTENWSGVDFATAKTQNGREILPTEYACYQSHLTALRAFLDEDKPYGLIIEDDVAFDESTVRRIEAIITAVSDFDAIKLTTHRTGLFVRAVTTTCGDEIGRALHGPQGSAAAYLVTRRGAQRLISKLATMTLPWDIALERFWDSGLEVYSTRRNILNFTSRSAVSSIAGPSGSYKGARFSWWKRLGTASFRTKDQFRRLHHVFLRPPLYGEAPDYPTSQQHLLWQILATLLVLAFVSPVWREADTYRYAGIILFMAGIVRWLGKDLWTYGKPLIGGVGYLCFGWAIYVFARLAAVYFTSGQLGTAEGVYLFPAFYATTGFALLAYVKRPAVVAACFMVASLAFLAADTSYIQVLQGEWPKPWLFNNTIHAAIAAGFIFLSAIQFAIYTGQRSDLKAGNRVFYWLLSAAVLVFAVVNIVALRSKGVWLALAAALLLLVVLALIRGSRHHMFVGIGVLVLILVGLFFSYGILSSTAGDTVAFIGTSISDVTTNGVGNALDHAIKSELTPTSAKERLMLWSNAVEIWRHHPVFGASSAWLTEWQNRAYQTQIYDVFHNGYLEIAVRYGIVGLAFYAFLFSWAARQVQQAARTKLIEPAAWHCYISTLVFFAITLLSNSNNRLAIGEAYMWFAAAFGFYCYYLRQHARQVEPRTYF
ncbi:O-antigen ligase family protein [Mesorhizobium sp. NPDC059054]|uniref:O-antigen ligase family protein n=1 Tax=Mesorhizobium sp. NPDC059054 TaxID=3346711 RepID=UPI0036A01B0E